MHSTPREFGARAIRAEPAREGRVSRV
jgi:hypothetical protein